MAEHCARLKLYFAATEAGPEALNDFCGSCNRLKTHESATLPNSLFQFLNPQDINAGK